MNNPYVKEILKAYERKRDYAKSMREKRIQEVYHRIPKLEVIDRETAKLGLSISRAILSHPEAGEKIVLKARQDLEDYKQQKAFLLTENNFPLEYLEIHHECNDCKDTGFLTSGEKCRCFKQQLINYAYEMSNLSHVLQKENFHTFNIELFSDQPFKGQESSPRENILEILNICEGFVFNFDKNNEENILFYGPTGLGKTFLTNCIAKALIDKGKIVVYQTAFKLLQILEEIRFDGNGDRGKYNLLFECDLLIIDDLGTEMTNTFTNSELFNILNSRLLAHKKTVVSTNLSIKEIMSRYDDRIFSRLLSNSKFTVLKFYGQDLRWQVQQ